MLTLQRASAGSGKTYTLTKKYIRLLISISENGKKPRLRNDVELRDSVFHILAITFTNKATAEMTDRILTRLDELANKADYSRPEDTTYMKEFMDEFDASAEDISHACSVALHQLLYSFSDFNVRTIDTFFQSVLRTFAYESDLPDNYEVIIDNSFISRLAVSSMLDAYNDRTLDPETFFFLQERVREEMKAKEVAHWNIFNKIEAGNQHTSNLFSKLCKLADSLDSETSKEAIKQLNDYYDEFGGLLENRKKVDKYFFDIQIDRFAELRQAAHNLISTYTSALSSTIPGASLGNYIPGKANFLNNLYDKILDEKANPHARFNHTPKERSLAKGLFSGLKAAEKRAIAPYTDDCIRAFTEFDEAYAAWNETFSSELFLWQEFRKGFTNLALLHDIAKRIDSLMQDSGTLQLSNTNRMLNRIISDDDVPFIYERIGTRLNHFLIDEFQDTSLLQWENILPLLRESNGNQHENLIIGDAKQSIYRFRGAEPTLITEHVPAAFKDRDERGYSVDENSNRRSERRIIEFNNFIFRGVSKKLGNGIDELYANTVQYPANRDDLGYTEVLYYNPNIKFPGDEDESSSKKVPAVIGSRLGEMIYDMHKRGFLWKEIAVLVTSNQAAAEVIEYLIEFNRRLPAGAPKIEFVSEEALTLSSSEAVRSVIGCLRMIQTGMEGKLAADEESTQNNSGHQDRINWSDIAGHFRYYSIRNPHLSLQERMERFLDGDFEGDIIEKIIQEMQAVTLPSLVEALTEAFVPEPMRREEAVFLAAFQDAVLDYCDVHPADIGSMLRWWQRQGARSCISSPEGTDAVSIMTIHKSKGLEFECVILPEFNLEFKDKKTINWVKVPENFPCADILPKQIRVEMKTTSDSAKKDNPLMGWELTPFADALASSNHFEIIDTLNKGYVAMTRPISELYIFVPQSNSKNESLHKIMDSLLKNPQEYIEEFDKDDPGMLIDPNLLSSKHFAWEKNHYEESENEEDADETRYYYGKKSSIVTSSVLERRKNKESKAEQRGLDDYFVNSDRPILQYREENAPRFVTLGDDDRVDPRSEGSLLHAVLEHVEIEQDLPKAFERLRLRGMLTRDDIPEYFEKLSRALESVRERRWFDGTYRVLSERPILKEGTMMHRPDRVMLDREGKAIVVDYKFGTSKDNGDHLKQVRNYMYRVSRALGGAKVKGYLWYINEDKIEEVAPWTKKK